MAYFVVDPIQLTPKIVAASSYTLTLSSLGLTLVNDDRLIIGIICASTSGTLSVSGASWVEDVELDVSSGNRMAIYSVKVAAGTAADPTITLSAGSGLWQGWIAQVRDADATTLSAGLVSTDHGSVSSGTTAAMTPSSDNALVIYFVGLRDPGNAVAGRFLPADVVGEVIQKIDDTVAFPSILMGTVQQTTAAASAKTFYNNQATRSGSIVLAIKNKTSGKLNKHGVAGVTRVAWLGDFGTVHDGLTWGAPVSGGVTWDGAGNINGIVVNAGSSTSPLSAGPTALWGTYTAAESTLNTASAWVGRTATLSAAMDFTGKIFSCEYYVTALTPYIGAEGAIIAFRDSGGNWAAFQLSQKLGFAYSVSNVATIAVNTATPYASGGTIAWNDVVSVTCLYHRTNSGTVSREVAFRNMLLLSATTLEGGNSVVPLDITYLDHVLNGWGFIGLCRKQGTAILQNSKVQIGDGSFATYFDATASLESFQSAYNSLTQRAVNVTAGDLELRVKASASDTINLTACSIVASQAQNLVIDSGSSTSATYSTAGASIVGMGVTWKDGVPAVSATFKGGGIAAMGGADCTNCIFAAGTGTALISASTGFSATGCTFTASATAVYGIRIAAAGTFDLASTTFSGFTKDIDVTATTGTVTINLAAGQATPTYQTAGATVTIVSSPVFQTVTLTGFTAGSRIWIKDVTSGNVLFNGTSSAGDTVISGSSCVWTDPAAATASRQIAVRVAYQSTVTAKRFVDVANIGTCTTAAGGEDVSYIVAQEADTTYNSNAIDGSTIADVTFTDAATDLVVCNLAGGSTTYPRLYAAFVYWLFTSAGIDDDVTYIDAPDTSNYKFTSMKIRNSNATALTITGGYGYDATSGLVADIIDVAGSTGNIYPQPDHVVPFATGSGVTSQDKIDIASQVLTAADAAGGIHADAKKMNGYTINGSGVSSDLWRGA